MAITQAKAPTNLPGASPIDAYERALNNEIQAWSSGQRGLTTNWLNNAVSRGQQQFDLARQQQNQEALQSAQKRGITSSSILDSNYANINRNYMQNIENLRKDLEIQRGLTNIQARQFGVNAGLTSAGQKRSSMEQSANIGYNYANLGQQAQIYDDKSQQAQQLIDLQRYKMGLPAYNPALGAGNYTNAGPIPGQPSTYLNGQNISSPLSSYVVNPDGSVTNSANLGYHPSGNYMHTVSAMDMNNPGYSGGTKYLSQGTIGSLRRPAPWASKSGTMSSSFTPAGMGSLPTTISESPIDHMPYYQNASRGLLGRY